MALSRNSVKEVPKDAVILTEEEALSYQWSIISKWDKLSDVWALKYAPGVFGGLSVISSLYVNNYYRTRLRLGNYGKLSSYLPIVLMPAMLSLTGHKLFIQRSIILEPMEGCPLCVQLRAALMQSGLGIVYPTLIAPFAAFMFATRHYTYKLPSITENPKDVFKLLNKLTRPIVPVLGGFMAAQALVTMYLTNKEQIQALRIQAKMRQFEQGLEDSLILDPTSVFKE